MLDRLHLGAINMHPSLLPKVLCSLMLLLAWSPTHLGCSWWQYRGAAPIHHALLNGDATTGVSVIEIDPRAFDVGRVLLQRPRDIPEGVQCHQ